MKKHVGLLAFFALIAFLVLAWPLFHARTHIPGRTTTDYYYFHWGYWWIRHALTHADLQVYQTNFILFPFQVNLAYHTLTPFWFPIWALTEPLIGTLPSFYLIFVLCMTLTGYSLYLFLRSEGVSRGLALVSGVALETTPLMMHALYWGWIDLVAWFWLPVQLLLWAQVARHAHHWKWGLAWALLQGVALWAMGLTDLLFFVFLAFLLIPYGLLTLLRARTWRLRFRLSTLGTLVVGLSLLLLWFFGPLSHLSETDRSTFVPPPAETAPHLTFPDDFLDVNINYGEQFAVGAYVLPLLVLSLAVYFTPLRRRIQLKWDRRWFWLALALPPLIIALGAKVTVAGHTFKNYLFLWLYDASGKLFRFPARLAPVFIMLLLVFIGLTWTPLIKKRGQQMVVASGLLLVILSSTHVLRPMPIREPPRQYSFYEIMGQEQEEYVVLEVPVAAGTGEYWVGDLDAIELQFNGMTHGKQMVNSFLSRAPLADYWYLRTDDPMLSWLGQRRLLEPELVEQQLRERILDWPIGYIVVHQDLIGMNTSINQEIIGYFNSLPDLLCPFAVEEGAVAFRTTWHPAGCPPRIPREVSPGQYQIDIGASDDVRYLGWGWHWPENISGLLLRWTGEYPQAKLYVDLPPGAYDVTVIAQAFWEPRILRLLVNGVPAPLADNSSDNTAAIPTNTLVPATFTVDAETIGDGQYITLELAYDGWVVPAEVGQSGDTRKLALLIDQITFQRH
ncbi:MAG TPA: hypothetical protein VHP83_16560 [Aggregatilineaceae bacterium]|nr:hypothetical protein [Aggregatilineaceae bacterium]